MERYKQKASMVLSSPTESSRVRKERDDESNAAVETPSKKSKHVGKNEVATPIAEDGNNGELVAPSPDVPSREVYRIPSHAGQCVKPLMEPFFLCLCNRTS